MFDQSRSSGRMGRLLHGAVAPTESMGAPTSLRPHEVGTVELRAVLTIVARSWTQDGSNEGTLANDIPDIYPTFSGSSGCWRR